ncbi:MAG: hypothetical protein JJU40_07160 [Rhodobacteraceae bacterium]|nr:hypothetical protein [Paracoccaceae bacterium]
MIQPLAPGEIVEIETPAGLAYVQVTHLHPAYPEVVRGLAGLHMSRPADLEMLARAPTCLTVLSPLGAALSRNEMQARRLGRASLPEQARRFPVFRMPIRDRRGGIVYWWFWDGEGLSLMPPQGAPGESLPLREVTPPAALASRLAAACAA